MPTLLPSSTAPSDVLSVSDINRRVRQQLELGIGQVWIEGELSGVSRPVSGHVYFTLKDATAQLRCVLFRSQARFVSSPMQDGDRVKVRGDISLYEPRGDYQLLANAVQPSGEGELWAAYEQLKQRLDNEGIFANSRPLAHPPRRLLMLTSANGAAIRDVLAVLQHRWPLVEVSLIPVPVQGKAAAPAMIAALSLLNRQSALCAEHDVVLITRGGGSLEDLWTFNDEHLARAIFHSRLPVMSAVGHEVDVTLADFAADRRAPTPSAAAEQLVPERAILAGQIKAIERQLASSQHRRLHNEAQRLDYLRARLRHPEAVLTQQNRELSQLKARLIRSTVANLTKSQQHHQQLRQRLERRSPGQYLNEEKQTLDDLYRRLHAGVRREQLTHRQHLAGVIRELQAVSPLAVLGRGYAIVQDDSGQVIRQAQDTRPDQQLSVQLGKGTLRVKVEKNQ
ncbi:exodeoxyribonuclease VII large subunit [Halomonas halocynthiae]|uniref:exodeoxyribonuclease VII large subunit n=1 Tax=Halomonas halocynthiae TaxID=176290 RepID=UPI000409C0B6|nr:exodeoxyribonuclease VII large subunit [Halomonas halocynthiae]